MAPDRNRVIPACSDLAPGTKIEAWDHGQLVRCGRVSQTVPSVGMVWIIDARNGTRRLLDVDALDVVRLNESLESPAAEPGDVA